MNDFSTLFYFINNVDEQIILMEDGTSLSSFCEDNFPLEEPSDDVLQKIMAMAQ